MDLYIGLGVFLSALILSIIFKVQILVPVTIGMISLTAVGLYRGYSPKTMAGFILQGMKRSLGVIKIFVFIGMITGIWRGCGAIPYLVYQSIRLIHPSLFLVLAFLVTATVSYMLGTCFGTASTIGVVLIVIAKSGGISVPLAAGAILSGAYVGDRGAPTSSCANLVATFTGTELYGNVKNMMKNALVPLLLTTGIYLIFSFGNPLQTANTGIMTELSIAFSFNWTLLIPALIILILPMFKVRVVTAMGTSVLMACILAFVVQGISLESIAGILIFGFSMENNPVLGPVLSGGGLLSMVKTGALVLISSSYSGIFKGTGMLDDIQTKVELLCEKIGNFPAMILTGTGCLMVACNQTLAIMMVEQLMGNPYKERGDNQELAMQIADSVVPIAGLIPWAISCTVPLTAMDAPTSSVIYGCFLYLLPLWAYIRYRRKGRVR